MFTSHVYFLQLKLYQLYYWPILPTITLLLLMVSLLTIVDLQVEKKGQGQMTASEI